MDAPKSHVGDFHIVDMAVHETLSFREAVVGRCQENLNDGYRPILVTIRERVAVDEALASDKELGDRIDIFEIEHFVALNLYELSSFAAEGRQMAIDDLVNGYNKIIKEMEPDPSLKVEIRKSYNE